MWTYLCIMSQMTCCIFMWYFKMCLPSAIKVAEMKTGQSLLARRSLSLTLIMEQFLIDLTSWCIIFNGSAASVLISFSIREDEHLSLFLSLFSLSLLSFFYLPLFSHTLFLFHSLLYHYFSLYLFLLFLSSLSQAWSFSACLQELTFPASKPYSQF